jgi:hypothetical protein
VHVDEPFQPEPAPAHVLELAHTCSRLVEKATGVPLDLSPDTLPLLDHYLRGLAAEPDEARNLVATAAGAYFGEVVRSRFPCRWHAPQSDYGAWRIEFEQVFLHFNPVAFAHEAIMSEEVVEGGTGFGVLDDDLDAVRGGLEALGTISEEDYFRLATRFEVLTTVVDRLAGASIAANEPVVSFDAEAYRVTLDGERSSAS